MWPSSGQLSLTVTLQVPTSSTTEGPPPRGQGAGTSTCRVLVCPETWLLALSTHAHRCTQMHTCLAYTCAHIYTTIDAYTTHMHTHTHTQPHTPSCQGGSPCCLPQPPSPPPSFSLASSLTWVPDCELSATLITQLPKDKEPAPWPLNSQRLHEGDSDIKSQPRGQTAHALDTGGPEVGFRTSLPMCCVS